MALALLVRQANDRAILLPNVKHIFCYSAAAYAVGFGLSLTWPGALVSTPLVSAGMAGIFYCAWEGFFRKIPLLSYILLWIGIESYAIYLIHQTPLRWTSAFFQGTPHVIAAALVLACSFPVGYMLRRTVEGIRQNLPQIRSSCDLTNVSFSISLAILCTLAIVEPCINNPLYYRHFALLLGLVCTALVYIECIQPEQEKAVLRSLRWMALFGSLIKLFVLPQGRGPEAVFIGMLFGLSSLLIYLKCRRRYFSWAMAILMLLAGCMGSEYALKQVRPLEIGCWGELPALQVHPTRTYSLKPNQATHLKYNNYDYIVKTNSMGLASPEILAARPTKETFRILILGNAFTMPEGLPYEEAYPAILQSELSKRFNPHAMQVINAGVTGYSFVEEYEQLRELGPILRPNLVVMQCFNTEFDWGFQTPKERIQEIGLAVRSKSKYREYLQRSQLLAYSSLLQTRLREIITGRPGGWRYNKALLAFYKKDNNAYYSTERVEKVGKYLFSIKQLCDDLGARIVIYFVPGALTVSKPSDLSYFPLGENLGDASRYDLELPYRHLSQVAAEAGIRCINLRSALQAHDVQPVYFRDSLHWNQEGHKAAAYAIMSDLIAQGYIAH